MENNRENFYSRQIFAYGYETVKMLSKLKILIFGLRGLGMEIAKNLILSGPKEVYLYDKNKITIFDLCSGFYFSEEQINKINRDEGCKEQLSKLNPFVEVKILNDNIIAAINKKLFNIIIITEFIEKETLYEINDICRKNSIGFIYGCVTGLIGFIFVDFGNKFYIYNKFGKEPKTYHIQNISNEKNAIIEIDHSSIQDKFLSNDSYSISCGHIATCHCRTIPNFKIVKSEYYLFVIVSLHEIMINFYKRLIYINKFKIIKFRLNNKMKKG